MLKSKTSFRWISQLLLVATVVSLLGVFNATKIHALEDSCVHDKLGEVINDTSSEAYDSAQSTFSNKTISFCEYIYNLDDSPDYIYIAFEEGGYALFSSITMEMMEYSLQGELPYSKSATRDYYAGPTNYLQKA